MGKRERPERNEKTEGSEEHKPPTEPLQAPIGGADASRAQAPPLPLEHEAHEKPYQDQQLALIERQVRAAEKLNCITAWAAFVGAAGIAVLVVTLLVTKQSADTASRQLELSERPWVSVDFEIVQPLIFDAKGASLGLRVHLKNIGHSVAFKVMFRESLFPVNLTGTFKDIYSLPVAEESRMCKPTPWLIQMSSSITGFRLFPNEDVLQIDNVRAAQEDISKATTWLNTPNPKGPLNRVGMMLVGCINYESIFGHHHTGFLRALGTVQPDGETIIAIEPTGKHPDVSLQEIPIGNSAD